MFFASRVGGTIGVFQGCNDVRVAAALRRAPAVLGESGAPPAQVRRRYNRRNSARHTREAFIAGTKEAAGTPFDVHAIV